MASTFDTIQDSPQAAPPQRFGWLKANAGSFAIAGALLFAAGTYGFVSSPAFATFFMGLVVFAIMWVMAASCLSTGDFVGGAIAFFIWIASIAVLFGAVEEAMRQNGVLHAAQVKAVAS